MAALINIKRQTSSLRSSSGQSATELAIFGAILIFIIGLIVRQAFSANYFMNAQLKAMRMALSESYRTAEFGFAGQTSPARNSASVFVLEDRVMGDLVGKFGSRDRSPIVASGSGIFSKNLFFPTDFGETTGGVSVLPIYDVYINGQRFPFSISDFRTVPLPTAPGSLPDCAAPHPGGRCWDSNCLGGLGCVLLYKIVGNYAASTDWDESIASRFDLDFDLVPDVPVLERSQFMWQWVSVPAINGSINPEEGLNATLDVDGDLKEETIKSIGGVDGDGRITSLNVVDNQEGDIDMTRDDRDGTDIRLGIQDDSQMFSFTRNGTTLRIEEGKLFNPTDGSFVRTTNRNDHVDIIQRMFRLSRDTNRFCDAGGNPVATVAGLSNPVEACNNCFSPANVQRTCMDEGALIIFIRSRIQNDMGRKWITRTGGP